MTTKLQEGVYALMEQRSILIVDDQKDLCEMIETIFTNAGFTNLTIANTGAQALHQSCSTESQTGPWLTATGLRCRWRARFRNASTRAPGGVERAAATSGLRAS